MKLTTWLSRAAVGRYFSHFFERQWKKFLRSSPCKAMILAVWFPAVVSREGPQWEQLFFSFSLFRQKSLFMRGKFGRVVGWGYRVSQDSIGQFANILKEICIPTIGNDKCQAAFKDEGYIVTPKMLCAGQVQGGKDSCHGDSGGGFVSMDPVSGKWVLGGVVSWGSSLGCGLRNKYGVYVRVTEFIPWINRYMSWDPLNLIKM